MNNPGAATDARLRRIKKVREQSAAIATARVQEYRQQVQAGISAKEGELRASVASSTQQHVSCLQQRQRQALDSVAGAHRAARAANAQHGAQSSLRTLVAAQQAVVDRQRHQAALDAAAKARSAPAVRMQQRVKAMNDAKARAQRRTKLMAKHHLQQQQQGTKRKRPPLPAATALHKMKAGGSKRASAINRNIFVAPARPSGGASASPLATGSMAERYDAAKQAHVARIREQQAQADARGKAALQRAQLGQEREMIERSLARCVHAQHGAAARAIQARAMQEPGHARRERLGGDRAAPRPPVRASVHEIERVFEASLLPFMTRGTAAAAGGGGGAGGSPASAGGAGGAGGYDDARPRKLPARLASVATTRGGGGGSGRLGQSSTAAAAAGGRVAPRPATATAAVGRSTAEAGPSRAAAALAATRPAVPRRAASAGAAPKPRWNASARLAPPCTKPGPTVLAMAALRHGSSGGTAAAHMPAAAAAGRGCYSSSSSDTSGGGSSSSDSGSDSGRSDGSRGSSATASNASDSEDDLAPAASRKPAYGRDTARRSSPADDAHQGCILVDGRPITPLACRTAAGAAGGHAHAARQRHDQEEQEARPLHDLHDCVISLWDAVAEQAAAVLDGSPAAAAAPAGAAGGSPSASAVTPPGSQQQSWLSSLSSGGSASSLLSPLSGLTELGACMEQVGGRCKAGVSGAASPGLASGLAGTSILGCTTDGSSGTGGGSSRGTPSSADTDALVRQLARLTRGSPEGVPPQRAPADAGVSLPSLPPSADTSPLPGSSLGGCLREFDAQFRELRRVVGGHAGPAAAAAMDGGGGGASTTGSGSPASSAAVSTPAFVSPLMHATQLSASVRSTLSQLQPKLSSSVCGQASSAGRPPAVVAATPSRTAPQRPAAAAPPAAAPSSSGSGSGGGHPDALAQLLHELSLSPLSSLSAASTPLTGATMQTAVSPATAQRAAAQGAGGGGALDAAALQRMLCEADLSSIPTSPFSSSVTGGGSFCGF